MIKLLTEIHPWEFDFWGGALNRMEDATQYQRDRVYERIEEVFGYLNYVDEDILNNFVWFECDDIFFEDEDEDEEED